MFAYFSTYGPNGALSPKYSPIFEQRPIALAGRNTRTVIISASPAEFTSRDSRIRGRGHAMRKGSRGGVLTVCTTGALNKV